MTSGRLSKPVLSHHNIGFRSAFGGPFCSEKLLMRGNVIGGHAYNVGGKKAAQARD
jgi:hypothetical protein